MRRKKNKKMDDNELEEIRARRLGQIRQQQEESLRQQAQEEAQLQQQINQLEAVVKQFFTKEALTRYGNLKAAHPEKAVQLLVILGQAVQSGQLKEKIDDIKLKELLKRLTPEKKGFKIKRI